MVKSSTHLLPELTKHQSLVFNALMREQNPASAYALLDQLRSDGIRAPQQVYRALKKLIEHGLVHRVESLNSFVACAHPHAHNKGLAVFAICDQCGHAAEFSDTAIARRLKGWANENAFQMATASIEIHGTCKRCQMRPAPRKARASS